MIEKILDKYSIGIAHHKVIHLVAQYEEYNIRIIKKLKITKQNRVIKDLIKLQIIIFKKDQIDTRVKHVYLNEKVLILFDEIFSTKKKRIYMALINSDSKEVLNFNNVLKKIINE